MWRYFLPGILCLESFCNLRGTLQKRGAGGQSATSCHRPLDLFLTDIIALAGWAVSVADEAWKQTIWYH